MNPNKLNGPNNDLINSDEIKNNNLISSQEFMFNFLNSKFLWKELMKINVKYIERSADISLITPYVQNILCSRLTLDHLDMLSEDYIIQLITLLQLTGQYLVYTQKMLEEENEQLKESINYLKNNLTENEKYQKIIEDLNRKNQEKDFLIKNYQDMIQTGNRFNDIYNDDDSNANLKSNKDSNNSKKVYYYCSICSGKKFKSQQYLDEHMERRHYNQKDLFNRNGDREERKVQERNYRQEFETKLNLMKNEIESMIKQKEESNDFAILIKRLEALQNQILQQNNNIGFNFRNNINYQNSANIKQNHTIKESNVDFKKKYEDAKREIRDLSKKNEEKEKLLAELQNYMARIGTNKINNKNPIIDDYKEKYNYNEMAENNSKAKIKRNKNKYNTNDLINNKEKDSEDKNALIDINKNSEKRENQNNINVSFNKEDKTNESIINNQKPFYDKDNREDKRDNGEKIFNNNGIKTPMDEDTQVKNPKENEKIINNKQAINNFNNIKQSEISNQYESQNILADINSEDENEEKLKTKIEKVPENPSPFINKNDLYTKKNKADDFTLSKFYQEFEERNLKYEGDKDYYKIEIPEKYNKDIEDKINHKIEDIEGKLNNSKYSDNIKTLIGNKEKKDQIYKKNYEKLNKVLNIEGILNSYNKYQKEKFPNQMVARNSGSNRNSSANNRNSKDLGTFRPSKQTGERPSGKSFALKSSANEEYKPDINKPNPFKNNNHDTNV